MKIIIEVVGSVMRVEIDDQEIEIPASSHADEPCQPVKATATAEDHSGRGLDGEPGTKLKSRPKATVVASTAETNSVGSSSGRTADFDSADAGSNPAPATTSKPYVLRPHCQRPNAEDCGGVGTQHCHSCTMAMGEAA